jgi:hypothetical protein
MTTTSTLAGKPAPVHPQCGVCGADVRPPFQPPPSDTSPDLDMRPGEPARSTLRRWVATCPFCEAVAPDLTRLHHAAKVGLNSPSYFAVKGPRASVPFVRWSMLCAQSERAEALLHAAWAADDAGETAAAVSYRKQAAACWPEPMPAASALRLVDVLRRTGDLEGAAAQAAALDNVPLDETLSSTLAYQRNLVEAGDTGRHLLSSAVPQSAGRPHVTPTQEPAPIGPRGGFWSWLKRG